MQATCAVLPLDRSYLHKAHNTPSDVASADRDFHRGMERTGSGHSLASHDAKVRGLLWHTQGSGAAAAPCWCST